MSDTYNKYLSSILHIFAIKDTTVLLDKLGVILNDPADLYYNYVQEDEELRLKNLLDHMVDKYSETNNNEFYKCIWNVIHMIPLIADFESDETKIRIKYFYKDYLVKKIGCVNCIMHYIYNVSEATESTFENKESLFDFFVDLHNEVNLERGKMAYSSQAVKDSLSHILELYPIV